MIRILCILFLLVPLSLSFSAQFYKWYDENGVLHVGDQPPRTPIENTESMRLQDNANVPSGTTPTYQRNFDQSGQKHDKPRAKARKYNDRDLSKCNEKYLKLIKKAGDTKYVRGIRSRSKLAKVQSDLCSVMRSLNKEQSEECLDKVEELIKKAGESKYARGSEASAELARIQLNHCSGRSSPKIEKRATGPLKQISKFNYVDADGNVWHCPSVMGARTIDVDRDCTPQ